jgi:diacylglycerol kinase family enzyme
MLVLLNPAAGGGRALARWRQVARSLNGQLGPFELCESGAPERVESRIAWCLRLGERRFVAAGGDGTVNLLIASLVNVATPADLAEVRIGAVGLGSSNDFHKPFRNGGRRGVPCRLDFGAAVLRDLGVLLYTDPDGVARRRCWINNASVGVTADGNYRFNQPDILLRWLKRVSTGAGIGYAALSALMAHRPRQLILQSDEGPVAAVSVSNLGVVKNPHFAGSLRYDSPFEPASGKFFVHLLAGQRPLRLLQALIGLARGRFAGRFGSRSWQATRLGIDAPAPFPIEVDGEVVLARRACFALRPGGLRVCP